jgi:zinc protease
MLRTSLEAVPESERGTIRSNRLLLERFSLTRLLLLGGCMIFRRLLVILSLFMLCIATGADAENATTPVKLDNGLEIYLIPDDTVPLVLFSIVFRTGAMVETPEYDGLSHLYEHMLFKSNALYHSQEEFDAALKAIGCPSWNGGTSTEKVEYFAQVPFDQLENVTKFWATTVRTNYVNQAELAKEKEVVINELQMYMGDPQRVFYDKLTKALFTTYYSRKNIGGTPEVIKTATEEQLTWLKKTYYVPNNCAIFIAGKFDAKDAVSQVKKYFGDWQRVEDPFVKYPIPKHPQLDQDKLVVSANLPGNNYFLWGLNYRGPDVVDESAETYPADVLSSMLTRKTGKFLTALGSFLWQKEAFQFGYFTQRNGGTINVSSQLLVEEPAKTKATVESLKKAIEAEFAKIAADPGYFSPEEIKDTIEGIEAERIYRSEDSGTKSEEISFFWAVSSADYYQKYSENLHKVTGKQLSEFVKKYLTGTHKVEFYWINSTVATQLGLEVEK